MAEPQVLPVSQKSVSANQIFFSGRVSSVSRYEGRIDTCVILPAPDSFSKPSLVRVNSAFKLGDAGDDVRVLCAYNGWSNNYVGKDGNQVKDVKGFFVAVE